ncbi:MAG: hypothetical protein AB7R55_05020 [Gemmatimonadales bacterium]
MRAIRCLLLLAAAPLATAGAQVGQGLIDPNVATDAQLASVPELTADLISAIKAARPIAGILDFDRLLGQTLSETERKAVYGKMFVHLNLNTATAAEINLIPGMTRRMVHEFEEYRPYKALAQFHREIGKYVDDAELARLERYVFVPLDLNTATAEAIMTIPGMTRRMLHEFEEYRPYRAIAQFRREIGKYVDEREVARLERFVEIRGAP